MKRPLNGLIRMICLIMKISLRPVDFHFDLRKNREWVELEREIAKSVRNLAKKQNIPTRKLVNELLRERLEHLQ